MVYDTLLQYVTDASQKSMTCIIAADVNASVGERREYDCEKTIGLHGVGSWNERGEMFVNWATLHDFSICNTHFGGSPSDLWTYSWNNTCRELDYFLVDHKHFRLVLNCLVDTNIDIGSDHRLVRLNFKLDMQHKHYQSAAKRVPRWRVD